MFTRPQIVMSDFQLNAIDSFSLSVSLARIIRQLSKMRHPINEKEETVNGRQGVFGR